MAAKNDRKSKLEVVVRLLVERAKWAPDQAKAESDANSGQCKALTTERRLITLSLTIRQFTIHEVTL